MNAKLTSEGSDGQPESERRWLASFAQLAAGESVSTVLRLLSIVVVARRLGTDRFGIASLGIVIGGYLAVVAHSGLDIGGTRAIAEQRQRAREELADIVGLRVALGITAFVATSVITALVPLRTETRFVVIGLAFTVVTNALDIRWAFVGLQQTRSVALASSISALWYLGGTLLFVRGTLGLAAFVGVHLSADLLSAAVQWTASRRLIGAWWPRRSSKERLRELYCQSISITVARSARTVMITLDVLLVKVFRPEMEVGQYALAGRIIATGITYIGLYYHAYFAALARAKDDFDLVDRLMATARRRVAMVGPPALVLMVVAAPVAIRTVFGVEWNGTIGLLQAMLPSLLCLAVTGVYSQALFAYGEQRVMARIALTVMVVNIAANLALLPTVGTVGASIATDVAEAVMVVLTIVAARKLPAVRHARAKPIVASPGGHDL